MMLSNVKKTDRVELENGLFATVTDVRTNWGRKTIFIRPDGGSYKTREYIENGATSNELFNVDRVLSTSSDTIIAEAKKKIEELQAIINSKASDGYEEKMMDFGDGRGMVKARRHLNPEGDFGGYVATTASVSSDSRVGRGSVVFGNARVSNGAKIKGNSRIGGNANVNGATLEAVEVMDRAVRPLAA